MGDYGRQLCLVLPLVPALLQELPDGLDSGGEGNPSLPAEEGGPLMSEDKGMLAAFQHLDAATDAISELKQNGYNDITVYSPAPMHELEHAVAHKVRREGRVVGLCHEHRARLARHDLRAVLCGRRHLFGRGHGGDAVGSVAQSF